MGLCVGKETLAWQLPGVEFAGGCGMLPDWKSEKSNLPERFLRNEQVSEFTNDTKKEGGPEGRTENYIRY